MNIILIHGAWHSAWVWDKIEPLLRECATVRAITLPGRIFEKTRAYRKLSLTDYVNEVGAYLQTLKGPNILVGHSLAGLIISQVAENHPELVNQLIYVCAFVPKNGECLFDITEQIKTPGVGTELTAIPKENQITIAKTQRTQHCFFGGCEKDVANVALSRLGPEPLKAFTTPVTLSASRFGTVDKRYIVCEHDEALLVTDQLRMLKQAGITQIDYLPTGHSPFLSMPVLLAENIKASIL